MGGERKRDMIDVTKKDGFIMQIIMKITYPSMKQCSQKVSIYCSMIPVLKWSSRKLIGLLKRGRSRRRILINRIKVLVE